MDMIAMSDMLAEMRLIIDGAVALYENEAAPIFRIVQEHGTLTAATAFDTIGTALYHLQKCVSTMQEKHIAAATETL